MACATSSPQVDSDQVALWGTSLGGGHVVTVAADDPSIAAVVAICVADEDTAASLPLAVRAAEQAPRGELRSYPGGHFAAYVGEVFEQMVSDQVKFLRRHLASTPAATAGAG